jgi:hypothetical protein
MSWMTDKSWLNYLKMQENIHSAEQQDRLFGPPAFCFISSAISFTENKAEGV